MNSNTPEDDPHRRKSGDVGDRWKLRYWSIFIGQALSLAGSALTQFVVMWWLTDTTGSVSVLATAGMAALLPQALLGPLGGIFADRYSRRLLMIGADLVSALCMVVLIVLFLTARIEPWHAYVMLFVRSAMQAFQSPAAAASTAMLVPRSFLSRSAGLNQTLQGLMYIAAAPLGALAISLLPIGWALGIDVLTALIGITPLIVFAIPQRAREEGNEANLWSELRDGVSFVWKNVGLTHLFVLQAAVVLVIMPSSTLVPLLVKQHFGGGANEVAVMESLWGIGMLLGGLAVTAAAPRRYVIWILFGFAASCFTFASSAMMPSGAFWLALVWWTISGGAFVVGNAPLTALLQDTVPNQMQGRVLSLANASMALAAPLGLMLAAPLGEWMGIRALFIATGVAGGLVCLVGFASRPMRNIAGPDQPR